MKHVIIINHQDSFTFNLVHLFREAGARVEVIENNQECVKLVDKKNPDALVFSPGPGSVDIKKDMGESNDIIQKYLGKIPILGVCLGHQLIGKVLNGSIETTSPAHGEKEKIKILNHSGLFKDLGDSIEVMRYHSQVIQQGSVDDEWITAKSQDGEIMAIEVPDKKLYGVQFHPESIGTPEGLKIIENFLSFI